MIYILYVPYYTHWNWPVEYRAHKLLHSLAGILSSAKIQISQQYSSIDNLAGEYIEQCIDMEEKFEWAVEFDESKDKLKEVDFTSS